MKFSATKRHCSSIDAARLEAEVEQVFRAEPRLRPNPQMHDYQLTYPPAIQVEQPRYAELPTRQRYRAEAIGGLRHAGFYFHFGFCQYRCGYCFHYELGRNSNRDLMSRYTEALCREMRVMRDWIGLEPLLYFMGGGTPTALPAACLERFLGQLLLLYGAPRTSMSTVEAKPVTASWEKLSMLHQAGFRRVSFGVQTLDPDLYAFHHQGEVLAVAYDAIERARHVGFEYINIDLMTGLHGQQRHHWLNTLERVEALLESAAIDSLFLYPYHDDPRSPTWQRAELRPDDASVIRTDAELRALMTRYHYKELGARFYRSPRHVRRELWELARLRVNPAYGNVLYHGFGNSAFSIGDRATYLNRRNVADYCQQVETHGVGVSHFVGLSREQQATRDITFDLLYSPFVRLRSLKAKYGKDAVAPHERALERWSNLGLGSFQPVWGTFRLSPLGKLVHQQMLPQLYLPEDHAAFTRVMQQRRSLGRVYRGY